MFIKENLQNIFKIFHPTYSKDKYKTNPVIVDGFNNSFMYITLHSMVTIKLKKEKLPKTFFTVSYKYFNKLLNNFLKNSKISIYGDKNINNISEFLYLKNKEQGLIYCLENYAAHYFKEEDPQIKKVNSKNYDLLYVGNRCFKGFMNLFKEQIKPALKQVKSKTKKELLSQISKLPIKNNFVKKFKKLFLNSKIKFNNIYYYQKDKDSPCLINLENKEMQIFIYVMPLEIYPDESKKVLENRIKEPFQPLV